MPEESFEIDVRELARRRAAGEPVELLDVRLEREREIAAIEGATWIPMAELGARWQELPADRPVVVFCHTGSRSARATEFLRHQGLPRAQNLRGGIEAWSREIDPEVPRY